MKKNDRGGAVSFRSLRAAGMTCLRPFVIMLAAFICLAAACEAFGAYKYQSMGKRDPFVPLVGVPEVLGAGGAAGIMSVDDISLEGILFAPDGEGQVIINGDMLREGQRVDMLYVESIKQNEVTVRIGEEIFVLRLYED